MLKNYLKIAYKVLLRRKFFTFISLFAISFTLIVLMVATAIFDHTYGPQPPEKKLDRTLGTFFVEISGPEMITNSGPGYRFLDGYTRNLPNVEKTSFSTMYTSVHSYHNGEKIKCYLKRTDGEFWQIMEFNFLEGAPFTQQDEQNRNFVAVINETTRKKFFKDAPALGKTIDVDGQRFRVVGVVKDVPILRRIPFSDIWVPNSTAKSDSYRQELVGDYIGLFLARSAADFPLIKQEFQARLSQVEFSDTKMFNSIKAQIGTFFEFSSTVFSSDGISNQPNRMIISIIVFTLLFMLLPTVNLININLSRIMERSSEIGVRKAFGASSRVLIGQFIIENLLLTLLGGVIGFIGSVLILKAISKSNLILYAQFQLNYRIFFYGLAVAIFFGLLSGVYPAWRMSKLHPVEALKGGLR
ncbi:MAG: FtsX-like permease family protein [Acidobacteriota bacterium]